MTKDKVKDQIKRVTEYYKMCLSYKAKRYASDEKVGPSFGDSVAILRHCRYMIDEISISLEQNEIKKALRWLGFLEGCLWTAGVFSLDELEGYRPS